MKNVLVLLSLLLVTTLSAQDQKVIGYLYGGEPSVSQIRSVTHLILSFITTDGVNGDINSSYSSERVTRIVETAQPFGVKTLVSFGGGGFIMPKEMITDDANRANFVSNLVQFVEENNLDGIDNDWEPDFTNYGAELEDEAHKYNNNVILRTYYNTLNAEIQDSLTARFGEGVKTLSAAVGDRDYTWYKYPEHKADNQVWPDSIWNHLDFVNLMTYGSDGGGTGHGDYASVFGSEIGVQFWDSLGMPKEKMVIGVPFYAAADWSNSISYSQIIDSFPEIDTTIDTVRHDFGFGEKLYGFNSIATLQKKVTEAANQNLYGVMIWALEHDLPVEHPLSLLRAINPPPVNPVNVAKPFDTLTTNSTFLHSVDLSEYFTADTGALTYSIFATPDRHSAVIHGDTLTITGDTVEEIAITNVEIKAESSLTPLNYQLNSLPIVINSREVITRIPAAEETNRVLTESWNLFTWSGVTMAPNANDQLYTITPDGDTVIHFIGTIANTAQWTDISLNYALEKPLDLTKDTVNITFQSDVNGTNVYTNLIFTDGDGVLHVYLLPNRPGVEQTAAVTGGMLKPGWAQPDSIDLTNIVSFSITTGSSNVAMVYNFTLKDFSIQYGESSPLADRQFHMNKSWSLNSLGNTFRIASVEPVTVSVFQANGRQVETLKGVQNMQFGESYSAGVYFVKVQGFNQVKTIRLLKK